MPTSNTAEAEAGTGAGLRICIELGLGLREEQRDYPSLIELNYEIHKRDLWILSH